MATAFGADDPFVIEQKRAQENLQQAQELKKYRPVQGPGMVSGIYVKSNPLQHLAELLRTYTGVEKEKEAQKQLTDISGRRNTAVTDALRGYTTNMMGAPASEAPKEMFVADDAGGGEMTMGTQVTPAVAPNPLAAYQSLMNAPDAAMRAQGMTGITQFQQAEAARQQKLADTQAADAKVQAQKDQQINLWQQSEGNPQKFLAAGGDFDFAQNMVTGKTLGTPTVVRTVETVDDRGRPVTQGYDANNNKVGPAIPKYVAPKAPTAGPAAPDRARSAER
jgi:hypothetical protein